MGGRLWRRIMQWLARLRWPIAGLAALFVVLACVLVIPPWLLRWELGASADTLAAADRAKAINDIRGTLLQGIGGAVLLLGAYFTWRQLQVAREGQVTERFTRAIDQLGHVELDVRLGGIYALDRIAHDSPEDRATIAEVLSAFVRGHAPWPPRLPGQDPAHAPIDQVPELQARAPDVQAALTMLAYRPRPPKPSGRLNLRAADLRKAVLVTADLQGADLDDANLQKADLRGAQLQGAHLANVQLQGTFLLGAQLKGAFLMGADLRGTGLLGAQLQEVHLPEAQLQLQGAYLVGADLREANLTDAKLQKAKLRGADLQGANLQGAILAGADLQEANLQGAQLNTARADATTTWPKGFDLHRAGVVLIGSDAETPTKRES